MRAVALALAVALAGCASSVDLSNPTGGGGSAMPPVCVTAATVAQDGATAPVGGPGQTMRVTSQVFGAPGVLDYAWSVLFNGATTPFTEVFNGTAIDVPVASPGIYLVSLLVTGGPATCPPVVQTINVAAPGALSAAIRLRVVPPRSVAAPATEQLFPISGGAAADLGAIRVDAGSLVHPSVLGPSGPLAAYLRFTLEGAIDPLAEAFSNSAGVGTVQLALARYSVLVVPSVDGAAPRRIAGWLPGTALQLDAGSPVTGTVRGPANAPLAGATVQLASDGVPSTLATTAGDGSFALRVVAGASVTVDVAPPAGSGLPRLSATSAFDLSAPLQIRYAANVTLVDLAGAAIRRGGAPLAGARITVVGSLAAVGTVTAGTQAAQVATGAVRIAATGDAAGILPATLVPSAALSAVVDAGRGDLAVVGLDTRSGAPASLDAAPLQLVTTALSDAGHTALPGAVVELVPSGALALAEAPTLRLTAGAGGAIAAMLPAGGHYELRMQDPARRAAPLVVLDTAITAISSSYLLPRAVSIQGALRSDSSLAVSGASVQLMCMDCTGIDRAMPLVEVVSDAGGRFTLAVPDPGTR